MKAVRIIDTTGPNPDYHPPRRQDFPAGAGGDEAFADAKALYAVPYEVVQPAGTLMSGPDCWVHCWEDAEGVEFDNRTAKPVRVAPGIVRAEPADAACQAKLDKHLLHVAAIRKQTLPQVKDYLAKLVAAGKARQAERDAAPPAKP